MSLFDQKRRVVAGTLIAVVFSTVLGLSPSVAAQEPPPVSAPPTHALERSYRGEGAIAALGRRLPEVAAAHDLKPGELMR